MHPSIPLALTQQSISFWRRFARGTVTFPHLVTVSLPSHTHSHFGWTLSQARNCTSSFIQTVSLLGSLQVNRTENSFKVKTKTVSVTVNTAESKWQSCEQTPSVSVPLQDCARNKPANLRANYLNGPVVGQRENREVQQEKGADRES